MGVGLEKRQRRDPGRKTCYRSVQQQRRWASLSRDDMGGDGRLVPCHRNGSADPVLANQLGRPPNRKKNKGVYKKAYLLYSSTWQRVLEEGLLRCISWGVNAKITRPTYWPSFLCTTMCLSPTHSLPGLETVRLTPKLHTPSLRLV